MQIYKLKTEDRELAEALAESIPSVFLVPSKWRELEASSKRLLFFQVVAPKYGFDPSSARFVGSVDRPSWDVEARPLNENALDSSRANPNGVAAR